MSIKALAKTNWVKYLLYFAILAAIIYNVSLVQIQDLTVLGYVIPGDYFETFLLLATFGIAVTLTTFLGGWLKVGFRRGGY